MQRSPSAAAAPGVPHSGTALLDRWPDDADTWPPDAAFGPWGHAPHAHPYGHLLYAASGSCELVTPDGTYEVHAAQAVWVPPTVTHSARFDAEFCPVVLEGARATAVDPADAGSPRVRTVPVGPDRRSALLATRRDHTRTARTLHAVLTAADQAGTGAPSAAATRAEPAWGTPTDATATGSPTDLHGPLTGPIAAALAADPASTLTLDAWAARLHVSTVSIRRAFLAETGMPYSRWRTRARLLVAVDRLRAGEPVTAVAHAVGLSHNGLLAACRRDLGLTPSSLRPRPPQV